MDDTAETRRAAAHVRDYLYPARWTLWTQRPGLIAYCLLAESTALVATIATAVSVQLDTRAVAMLAALAILGITQAELGRRVEHVRRRIAGTPHINMTSVWTASGVLLLPASLVAVLVTVLYWHLHVRSWYRLKQVPVFRSVINATVVILTCYITHAALAATGITDIREATHAGWAGVAAVATAVAVYFVVNAVLIIPALNITTPSVHTLLGGWADNLLEFATICLGALTALALATMPALAILTVPPLFIVHRAALVKQLEDAASHDDKTGVWNTAGWHNIARYELLRAGRKAGATLAVLMVDLDRFKRINDTYGHLVGDAVLKAVAGAITRAVRDYDSVGRFGGEEFVILLPDIAVADVSAVAERVRQAIAMLEISVLVEEKSTMIRGLSASIGIATYPVAGTVVERLVLRADRAMYKAKANGRNQISFAEI